MFKRQHGCSVQPFFFTAFTARGSACCLDQDGVLALGNWYSLLISRTRAMTTHSLVLDRTQTEGAKVSVGKQKICPDRELREIDPIWLFGPVPRWFWHAPQNRRNYLLWLGHKLGFHQMRDWYRLTYEDMAANCGNSVANVQWHGSPIEAVQECFPQHGWQEWLVNIRSSRFTPCFQRG